MEDLISTYGYPALVIGTFLEGETIVLVAGYLAKRGYLSLQWVAAYAFLGSWLGDTLFFFVGRRWGGALLQRCPAQRPAADRALRMLRRYHVSFILSFRFFYGLRTVSPFVIGMSEVPARRFVPLNMLAAAVWAGTFSLGGYLLGAGLETMLKEAEKFEAYVIGGLVAAGLAAWIVHTLLARRRQRKGAKPVAPDVTAPRKQEGTEDAR